jgi:hypothetical protein
MHYSNGLEIKLGDIVITGNQNKATVVKLIAADSIDAQHYSLPLGGILLLEEWPKAEGLVSIGSEQTWEIEHLEFISRCE